MTKTITTTSTQKQPSPDGDVMKQQVDVILKLSLWLDATLDEDDIVTHVRTALPTAFGEELTVMENPVDIIAVEEEAEIFGNELPPVDELPPDPDSQNDDRAAWARHALTAFRRLTGTDREDALCDLLCDLMHLCDRDKRLGEFTAQLERAREHYEAETVATEAA